MANDFNLNEFKLKDPVNSINDGLKEPVKDGTPGFFSSLRNPMDLMLEESLPASIYQWSTGNTKKKQAQEALEWIRNNPGQKESKIYNEAERKLKKFGYLLDEGGDFSFKEFGNLIKKHPGLVGAELVNSIIADPWLLAVPFIGIPRFGKGIVNLIRKAFPAKLKSQIFKGVALQPATPDLAMGALASLSLPLLFSVNYQLSEDLKFSGKRTTAETTIGATAGLLLGGLLKSTSMILSPRSFYDPNVILNKVTQFTKASDFTGDVHAFEKILNNLEDNFRSKTLVTLQEADPAFNIQHEFLNLADPPKTIIEYAKKHYQNKKQRLTKVHSFYVNEYRNHLLKRFPNIDPNESIWMMKVSDATTNHQKQLSFLKYNQWLFQTSINDLDDPAIRLMTKHAYNEHLDAFEELNTLIRPGLQSVETLAQNSVYKVVRPYLAVGGVVGAAQFLTADDQKLLATGKGFAVGAGALAGLKLGYKYISKKAKANWKDDIPNLEKESTSWGDERYRTMKFNLAQGERDAYHSFNWLKTNIPDQNARNSFGAYLLGISRTMEGRAYLKANGIEPILNLQEFSKKYDVPFIKIEKIINDNLLNIGEDFNKLGIVRNLREDYFPIMYEMPLRTTPEMFIQSMKKVYGPSKAFSHARERVFPDAWTGIQNGYKLKTLDVAEIYGNYLKNANKAFHVKLLIKDLTVKPATTVRYMPKETLAIQKTQQQKLPYIINNSKMHTYIEANVGTGVINDNYIQFNHRYLKAGIDDFIPRVHKSIEPWLKFIFNAQTENQIVQGMFLVNNTMKRMNVGFSFFHAGALLESMLFSHWNPRHAFKVLKLKKADIKLMHDDPIEWGKKNFSLHSNKLENSGFRDPIAFAEGSGLTLSKYGIEDQDFTRFKSMLRKFDASYTNLIPYKKITNDLGVNPGAMEKAFDWFDGITWDKIFSSAKLYSFMVNFEKLAAKHLKRDNTMTRADIARLGQNAAEVTNDAFGGLDWYRIAMNTNNPILKKIAMSVFNPGSRGWLQLLFFAPDWTIANFRIIAKAIPGMTEDPDLARIYQMYALRAAMYFGTIGTALNYMFSGHSQLDNKDPTRIDLGNGEVLTFSKQLMEPLHWVTDPQKTAIKKIGSLPRTTLELLFNKKYLTTGWSPNISKKDESAIDRAINIGGHAGQRFLPIWLQTAVQTASKGFEKDGISKDLAADVALEFVLGQIGHPKYKGPRTTQYKTQGLVRSPYETLF